jgi:iron complex outermembrane recepter protein
MMVITKTTHIFMALALAGVAAGQDALIASDEKKPNDLINLNLEDLMRMEVTTASKKAQALSEVAAPIFVITQDDIRRSAAQNIPDLLRMVPGVQVAQIDSNKWAISIRGFASRFANKLLVMIDGRTIYTPLFSGVFWDAHDVLLEDIDRIEVIRGPGGALWGANAVNGIIHIITKHAADTQGTYVAGAMGDYQKVLLEGRHGASLGEDGAFRVYGKYFERDSLRDITGMPSADAWNMARLGVRGDLSLRENGELMVQAEAHGGQLGQRTRFPVLQPPFATITDSRFPVEGWHALARWDKPLGDAASTTLQAYYDRSNRTMPELHEIRETFDLDFQHQTSLGDRRSLVWGAGFRTTADQTAATPVLALNPPSRRTNLFSAFGQTDLPIGRAFTLTLGSKFEHNDFTGFEYQPSARVLWTKSPTETAWAAIARAVRTPTRTEHDMILDVQAGPHESGLPLLARIVGNPAFRAEEVLAHEIGYRVKPNNQLFIDIAAFYNAYRNLRTFEPLQPQVTPTPTPHLLVPHTHANNVRGSTHGIELFVNWQAGQRWWVSGAYSYLEQNLRPAPGSQDPFGFLFNSPRHQVFLSTNYVMSADTDVSVSLHGVGREPEKNIPPYARLDARLAWRPNSALELIIGGQNLLQSRHQESASSLFEVPSTMRRMGYIKLAWRF